jgi:hypothetical protein
MSNLYKSKLASQPHIIRATKYREFLSARESIDETGKAYTYVCQRRRAVWYEDVPEESNPFYLDDENFEPFIMSEDIFNECYEEVER